MYILIFLVLLGVLTYWTNRTNGVENNYEFLQWTKKDIAIICATFLVAVVLQVINPFIWGYLVYAVGASLALVWVNKQREVFVQDYKKQIDQIYQATEKLLRVKEPDYNNLPYKIEKDGTKINKIIVEMNDPQRFTDANCTFTCNALKRYFPYFDWQFKLDAPQQICEFTGNKLPPEIALWNGSDLRGSNFIPVGISGNGEVGLMLAPGDVGESSYVFDDGDIATTVKFPDAPQALVVGSTGGGKAIYIHQELF